ncbi:disease resistance protein RPM1-like [Typha latifolia]|uniref:disease resistance protein RPM1-like n=1 Tax=Typha latifolia TaxID=4733 RepID=UPI003C2BAE75
MEEIVPSVPGSLVVSSIKKAIYWIELLAGKHTSVEDIKKDLKRMKELLEDTTGMEENNVVKATREEARELCNHMDDVIQTSHHFNNSDISGFSSCLRRYAHKILHTSSLCTMADQIVEIRSKVGPIQSVLIPFVASKQGRLQNCHIAPILEESDFIGMEEPKSMLFRELRTGGNNLKVITVTGMAGIGKTTLTRIIYEDWSIKANFDCHAWVTVEESFSTKQLLTNILIQLFRDTNTRLPEMIGIMETELLTNEIKQHLQGKRYIIVLDDLSKKSEQKVFFMHALPKYDYGRVVVTSRRKNVVEPSDCTIDLEPLSHELAMALFYRRTFGSELEVDCPLEFRDLSSKIVQLCHGLPLAIAVIGGLLLRKELPVWICLLSDLGRGNFQDATELLVTSINTLPESLKNCLFYFSMFPRNFSITPINLIRLWIAEGFVKEERGRTMEEVAHSYLTDLIDHNIIQVAGFYDYGRIKSCKVHGLLHQIILGKAEEENFGTSSMRHSPTIYKRIRRLSIQEREEDVPQKLSLSLLRALFIFREMSYMPEFFSSIKSLRVLNLEGALIKEFPKEIATLIHLRYLNLRNTSISELPKALGNLIYLETLNLKRTNLTTLPAEILKLLRLRHLLSYRYVEKKPALIYGVKVPTGIGRLKELQAFSVVVAEDSEIVKELGNLSQLRRLGIVKLRSKDGCNLCASIAKMKQLCSLSVTSTDNEPLDLQNLLAPSLVDQQNLLAGPPHLQRLYLRGKLQMLPPCFPHLHSIVRLRLRGSELSQDPFEVLQTLGNLAELSLIQAYIGQELCCKKGGFQKLKILDVEQLSNLITVTVLGAMPNLRKMIIRNCEKLESVPLGIRGLANLKELHLFEMPNQFLVTLRSTGEREKVQNIDKICYYYYEQGFPQELIELVLTEEFLDAQSSTSTSFYTACDGDTEEATSSPHEITPS